MACRGHSRLDTRFIRPRCSGTVILVDISAALRYGLGYHPAAYFCKELRRGTKPGYTPQEVNDLPRKLRWLLFECESHPVRHLPFVSVRQRPCHSGLEPFTGQRRLGGVRTRLLTFGSLWGYISGHVPLMDENVPLCPCRK
jgi:hypothetical protein